MASATCCELTSRTWPTCLQGDRHPSPSCSRYDVSASRITHGRESMTFPLSVTFPPDRGRDPLTDRLGRAAVRSARFPPPFGATSRAVLLSASCILFLTPTAIPRMLEILINQFIARRTNYCA
jgi:hypothetical protein